MLRSIGFFIAAVSLAGSLQAQTVLDKQPDLGPFWQPLDAQTGSYVYSDCFVAPAGTDVIPNSLGMWLSVFAPPGPSIRFEIWGDAAGPDAGTILATTGSLDPAPVGLDFISGVVQPGFQSLTPGNTYWFVATVVGESGSGQYQVGGHTQNSQQSDNCTFWYSNDPAGVVFDGQNNTPEMAFSVTLDDTPAPVELISFTVEGGR